MNENQIKRLPSHLKRSRIRTQSSVKVKEILKSLNLNTVCQSALCPNQCECFAKGTATFMILGNVCTRNCLFCAVQSGDPESINSDEPENIAKAVKELNLKHVVITSVTRDDLADGGAEQFAQTILKIRNVNPDIVIEVLIPDFKGDIDLLKIVLKAKPDILNHNVETVPRLYSQVRPDAIYERSLELLKNSKVIDESIYTKSGIMVGMGENEDEVIEVMKSLRVVGVDFITIGQYLAPSRKHFPVAEYITPEQFKKYKEAADKIGFKHTASDFFVRSSYQAEESFKAK